MIRQSFGVVALSLLALSGALAQNPAPGSSLQASNLLNPNISVIGWFQGEAGRRKLSSDEEAPAALQLKEAELAFQAVVDPYARADFFLAASGEGGTELEEGYLTWFDLPWDLSLKVGKFRANFGKFNRIHAPETSFADRPLVHELFFAEEGLAGTGASLSWHIPNPWVFLNLDAEATNAPERDEVPSFDKARRKDLLYVTRLSGYHDLTEALNVTMGGSYANGPSGQEFDVVNNSSSTLRTEFYGWDVTFRWKDPRRAMDRSLLWQTEVLWSRIGQANVSAASSRGLFSHLEYQFARRWRAGARYDFSGLPTNSNHHRQGGLLYLTFTPSEFNLISLQGKHVKREDGASENLGFVKVTFSIGPHGTHPF